MPQEKQVEFAYTVDDMKASERFCATMNDSDKKRRQRTLMIATQVTLTVCLIIHHLTLDFNLWITLLFIVDTLLVVSLLMVWLSSKSQIKQAYRDLPQTAPQLFELGLVRITPNGVYRRHVTGESIVPWNALAGVAETKTGIYFLNPALVEDGPQSAFGVPSHAFASDEALHDFALLARGFWDEARAAKSVTAAVR